MTAKITTGLNVLVAKSFRDNLRDTLNDDENNNGTIDKKRKE